MTGPCNEGLNPTDRNFQLRKRKVFLEFQFLKYYAVAVSRYQKSRNDKNNWWVPFTG